MTLNELKTEIINGIDTYAQAEAKKVFLQWIKTDILPMAKDMGTAYANAVKESSKDAQGWDKFRDTMVIPCIISAALWGIEKVIDKSMEVEG